MKSHKPTVAAVFFLSAVINIFSHISDYKNNKRPSGVRLVFATLNIVIGVLALMSDALEKKRAKENRLHINMVTDFDEQSDDISFEDEPLDDVTVCYEDFAECNN